jgi:alkanesulfonate monooxygenase SsuD/methylene tetrahydromethanopterin reductase-like flavin-dependent oxidoreductase (luciferase family)
MFTMRFDMRSPSTGAPASELYAAVLEMASWSESRGAVAVIISEHHVTGDGYLPSPMLLAAGLATQTNTIPIVIAALLLPLYHPVRLAEEMIVLDILSGGRVSYVAAIGYRAEEYELYGIDFHRRGRIADDQLDILIRAKTGEPFEYEGRTIHLMPAPVTTGGPRVAVGGGSLAAARRAGRHGLDFLAESGDPAMREAYEEEARANGREPGFCMLPPADLTTTMFVAGNVDRAWDELGPYMMHDVLSYASINQGKANIASVSAATSVEELRSEDRSHRIVSVDEAVSNARSGVPLPLHPLIGGLPPEIAWRYLRTVVDDVMPKLGGHEVIA